MKRLSTMTHADLAALPVGARFEWEGGGSLLTKDADGWGFSGGLRVSTARLAELAGAWAFGAKEWTLAPCPGCMGEPACVNEPCAWDLTTDNPPPAAKE